MKKNCYTLVELLVVMVIMAILLSIAVPAFDNLVNGNRVEQAAKQLVSAFNRARSEAIVKQKNVAFLMAVRQARDNSDNNVKNEFIHRAYAIVVLDSEGKVDYSALEEQPFEWHRLPARTFFSIVKDWKEDTKPRFFYRDGNSMASKPSEVSEEDWKKIKLDDVLPDKWEDTQFNVSDDSAQEIKKRAERTKKVYSTIFKKKEKDKFVRMIIFCPDGTVTQKNLSFFVTEGLVDAGGKILTEEIINKESDKKKEHPANSIGVKLNFLTGRVRYYNEIY